MVKYMFDGSVRILKRREGERLWFVGGEERLMEYNYRRYLQLFEVFTPKPRQPLNSFFNFIKQNNVSGKSYLQSMDEMKELVDQWRSLSDNEREKYKGSTAAKKEYARKCSEWKKKRLVEFATFELLFEKFEFEMPPDMPTREQIIEELRRLK